ncbi:hypothetical protein EV126DRAFT_416304 [Verticillium dahliae]|nr:hypothetical protein EV126DRAFT_416304 [Verticillium dahliae]
MLGTRRRGLSKLAYSGKAGELASVAGQESGSLSAISEPARSTVSIFQRPLLSVSQVKPTKAVGHNSSRDLVQSPRGSTNRLCSQRLTEAMRAAVLNEGESLI